MGSIASGKDLERTPKFRTPVKSHSINGPTGLVRSHKTEVNCNADLPGVTPKISVTLYKSEHKWALAKSNLKMQQKALSFSVH